MASIGKKASRIIGFLLGVLVVYMLSQPFVASSILNGAVYDQSGSGFGPTSQYRYYALGSGNTINARLAVLGNYSYDRVSFLSGGMLQFDMTSQYVNLPGNEFKFQVWNTTNGANPQVSIILPMPPTYVLNAQNYSYSGGALTINGQQSNQTVTVNVDILSSTKTIKIPSSTATLSSVSYDDGLNQLTVQCSQGSGSQVTVTGASQSPLSVSLNGSPSQSWSYATASDMLTLNGVGTWVVSYAASTTTILALYNFSLSNSGGITVEPGSSGSNVITVTGEAFAGGSPQAVNLSCSSLPTGASCSFNPSSHNPAYQSVLTMNTLASTAVGSYPIIVTGVAGPVSKTTSFTLNVTDSSFDISLLVMPLFSLQPGNSGSTTVQVNLVSGNPESVSLSCGNLPLGVTCSFGPALGMPTFQSGLTVSTTSSTPAGSWWITITGSAGSLSRSVQLSITITGTSTQVGQTLVTEIISGSGSVNPNCPNGCSYAAGQSVTLTASPSSGWQFSSWTIGGASCSGGSSGNPCTFSMPNNAVTVSPTFTQPCPGCAQITFITNPASAGSISWDSCSNPGYTNGQILLSSNFGAHEICYVPSGYTFSSWTCSGGLACASSTNPTTVTFTGPGTITLNLSTGSLSNPVSTSISTEVSPSPVQGGAQFTVSGNLTANGVGIGGEKVMLMFAWTATAVTVTTKSDGSFTYSANAPMQNGSYNIQVYFSGDIAGTSQYLPSTAMAKVSVS